MMRKRVWPDVKSAGAVDVGLFLMLNSRLEK
jgi:hypothetical protein